MEQLHQWRSFFESSGTDLMTVIDRAITIASLDTPRDLLLRREGFTEKLFAPSLRSPSELIELENAGSDGRDSDVLQVKDEGRNEIDDGHDRVSDPEMDDRAAYGYAEAEALSDEMEEESRQMKEILLIKDRLMNYHQSEEEEIFQSLKTLESMNISFEALRETEIGKQVNNFRKHSSKRVQSVARRLVRFWKTVVNEWYKSAGDLSAGALPGSLEENDGEFGLPSPPLDEGALLVARTTSLEMNQLFEFIDDDLSAGSGETNSLVDDENLHTDFSQNSLNDGLQFQLPAKHKSSEFAGNKSRPIKESVELDKMKKGADIRKGPDSGPSNAFRKKEKEASRGDQGSTVNKDIFPRDKGARDSRISANNDFTTKPSNGLLQTVRRNENLVRKPDVLSKQQEKGLKHGVTEKQGTPEVMSVTDRLAAAKRRLQEGYQQAENAKKQRTVQVMELQDLPKRGPNRVKAPIQSKPNFQNHNLHLSANRV
ncbi:hypothetical protein O6H91_15G026000 [Diphasiastrum complanatum]|uniref:Uncharacterized protein n=4 Tax=Diphasiastrum complanatum TaxID=34168 RepID=A0ACC2BGL7_DIPCM|nr:hypothetical protein O6H91_15G026000 [Diphasiastrum complanatum]KAJ7528935.1 hypothetical protein O6H91_15G026000 [Diphasiastrum complanatum]KAJ7528938.1 hypothetical protein O6H91_15G026000 [Diphasiastrum complanatum]KAJ7528942.1 hypothetical protein O6H91_15G026000 [Diphasiastrum complanatum]